MVSNAAIFRGDAEGFVDMLIAASRSKPVASPQLCALQGRELVPWQSEDSCSSAALLDMPLESSSSIRRSSPQQHYGSKFPQRQARPSTAAASAAAGGQGAGAKRGNNARAAGASGRRLSADHAPAPRIAGFACPVVAASPKPEALPMPTSSLLTRALVRRSPSPPKMMAAAVAVMA